MSFAEKYNKVNTIFDIDIKDFDFMDGYDFIAKYGNNIVKIDGLYINKKGILIIKEHAYDFINKRLKDPSKVNDGKQTPMKGHPVFIAQHATATCCRGCLEKWHYIPKDKILTEEEGSYIVDIIMSWINKEYNSN